MKHLTLVLSATLMISAAANGGGHRLRYVDPSGRMAVSVTHDIEIRGDHVVQARRELSFELSLTSGPGTEKIGVIVEQARAFSEAHGTRQRLGTRHLRGRGFPLVAGEGGRRLGGGEAPDPPVVELGPMVPGGFSIAGLLIDIMPVLPEGPLAVGSTWSTRRPIRSLEGWAWGAGSLTSRHRVTGIDDKGARTIVSVETEAEARLGPVEGERAYSGDLKRTAYWSFDATGGRLLSLSIRQETNGVSALGQADTPIHQRTEIELAPSEEPPAP